MKIHLTVCLMVLVLGASLACPVRPGGAGGPGGETSRLTLELDADTIGSRGHRVFVFVDDVPHTRDSAPFNDVTRLVRTLVAQNEFEMESLLIERGKTVTLVAFDGGRPAFGANSSVFDNESLNEFMAWIRDFTQDDIDAALQLGDLGVISFVMGDSDRVVTATFERMPLVIVHSVREDGPLGTSPGCVNLCVRVSGYLSFPNDEVIFNCDIPNVDPPLCLHGSPFLVGQLPTGSTVSLHPVPIEPQPPNLVFLRWEGDCQGSGDCVMVAGTHFTATAVWGEAGR